jgi:hypothetical protein
MGISCLDTAKGAFACTPSDTVPLPALANGLVIGSVGGGTTLTVICQDGSTVTFAVVSAGQVIPLSVKQIMATGTLASSIVGLK